MNPRHFRDWQEPGEGLIECLLTLAAKHPGTRPDLPHSDIAKFLLEHGRFFDNTLGPLDGFVGLERRCYHNAVEFMQQEIKRGKILHYVEGVALSGAKAIPHAWCVDEAGGIYDPTWTCGSRAYFGVPVIGPVAYLMALDQGCEGIIFKFSDLNKPGVLVTHHTDYFWSISLPPRPLRSPYHEPADRSFTQGHHPTRFVE